MSRKEKTYKRTRNPVGIIRAAQMDKLASRPNGKLLVMRMNGNPLTEAQRKQLDGE